MGRDVNYQVVYRGERLESYQPGGWVFFQRSRESGGGYWFGRTYDYCFMLEFDRPVSLAEGIRYTLTADRVAITAHLFDDDFELT
ncbi:hypothetical protein F3I27_21785 [Pantoea sp. Bo_2]|uniref:LF-82 n=1 Tax=Candidatus Pantoea gossypiicola TaxID=2608008 RepID=A0AB34CD44_9GAMM|nr:MULTISPECIES: hypothetical protein [Pantoea]KAA5937570.1 hypothetical protein F3I57_21260 [Pantoea sp. VH_3]KAA5946701.1 hypothetical protein F3I56_22045 [Pantoea sp. VH_25]KAA5949521.1 hypothetical protein F3I55_22400 [Pantoea sp. VH_24]KAA5957732.1 hypothetical protein F3I53_15895 [Pantoea sp. VH_16]KAA5959135.1 hypothetical protein F3I54_22430 [Pantoea sp. VH_18]